MSNPLQIDLLGQQLLLLPQKATFWADAKALIVSDAHFGKAGHFRKAGVPIPMSVHVADFDVLDKLIDQYQPQKLIFLGDLFHSQWNAEWQWFVQWLAQYAQLHVVLCKGNHDILAMGNYENANMVVRDVLEMPPFTFSHETFVGGGYNFAGHIHPAVRLKGKSRQGLRLPCFYFGKTYALLPAFGNFTGLATIKVHRGDQVYAITPDKVVPIVPGQS